MWRVDSYSMTTGFDLVLKFVEKGDEVRGGVFGTREVDWPIVVIACIIPKEVMKVDCRFFEWSWVHGAGPGSA